MSKLSREKQLRKEQGIPDYGEGTFKYSIEYHEAMSNEEVESLTPMAIANGTAMYTPLEKEGKMVIVNFAAIKKVTLLEVPKPRETTLIVPDNISGASNVRGINFNGS